MNVFDNIAAQWIIRRLLEVGGWLGAVASIFVGLPPEHQAVVIAIITGQGGGLTISAAIGLAVYLYSQVLSWRATVRPQVITEYAGRPVQVPLEQLPARDRQVVTEAARARPRRTLLDVLLGR